MRKFPRTWETLTIAIMILLSWKCVSSFLFFSLARMSYDKCFKNKRQENIYSVPHMPENHHQLFECLFADLILCHRYVFAFFAVFSWMMMKSGHEMWILGKEYEEGIQKKVRWHLTWLLLMCEEKGDERKFYFGVVRKQI